MKKRARMTAVVVSVVMAVQGSLYSSVYLAPPGAVESRFDGAVESGLDDVRSPNDLSFSEAVQLILYQILYKKPIWEENVLLVDARLNALDALSNHEEDGAEKVILMALVETRGKGEEKVLVSIEENEEILHKAIQILSNMGSVRSVPALEIFLRSDSESISNIAVVALFNVGERLMVGKQYGFAARALSLIVKKDSTIKGQKNQDNLRKRALKLLYHAIVWSEEHAHPLSSLAALLDSEISHHRTCAVQKLGVTGDPAARKLLEQLLESETGSNALKHEIREALNDFPGGDLASERITKGQSGAVTESM